MTEDYGYGWDESGADYWYGMCEEFSTAANGEPEAWAVFFCWDCWGF